MERITYRITLDAYKNGIQRTLQGFETADKLARRIAINLTSGGDTMELPSLNLVAMMYVTRPSATEPSIDECRIEGNTIIYDMPPITEEGVTTMQLKVIEADVTGAKKVFATPKIEVEVLESGTNDGGAMQTATFTALETAAAKAEAAYNARLLRVEFDHECVFYAYYADGTVYSNDSLKDAVYNTNNLLAESWAIGGTGIREGEDTDNSMYYSNVSKSAAEDARIISEDSRGILEEAIKHSAFTTIDIDFYSGNLEYFGQNVIFDIDPSNGDLLFTVKQYSDPDGMIRDAVSVYVAEGFGDWGVRIEELEDSFIKFNQKYMTDNENINGRFDEHEAVMLQIVSFDASTGTLVTKSCDHVE